MTPEQRETLEIFADCVDDELAGSETRGFTWAVVSVDRERYHALRAALAPAPTCGTCRHVKVSPPMCGLPALYMCGNKDAPAHRASCVSPDDGCIKGYAPTEPTR